MRKMGVQVSEKGTWVSEERGFAEVTEYKMNAFFVLAISKMKDNQ